MERNRHEQQYAILMEGIATISIPTEEISNCKQYQWWSRKYCTTREHLQLQYRY